jgi:Arc/MetJ-type ribon-helix-helix transcriptional regulator
LAGLGAARAAAVIRLTCGCERGLRAGLVGIDFGYTIGHTGGMRMSISLPDRMLKEADSAARKLKVSRSELLRTALREFLRQRQEAKMSESIDRYLAKHGNELSAEDEAWLAHGRNGTTRTGSHAMAGNASSPAQRV